MFGFSQDVVLVTGAAVLGAVALPRANAAADEGLAPAADFTGKVRAFLSGLEPDKRKAASFAWNGSEWRAVRDDPGPLPGDGWVLGAKGSRGKPGEKGERGEPGPAIAELVLADAELVLTHADGSALSVDLAPLREGRP